MIEVLQPATTSMNELGNALVKDELLQVDGIELRVSFIPEEQFAMAQIFLEDHQISHNFKTFEEARRWGIEEARSYARN